MANVDAHQGRLMVHRVRRVRVHLLGLLAASSLRDSVRVSQGPPSGSCPRPDDDYPCWAGHSTRAGRTNASAWLVSIDPRSLWPWLFLLWSAALHCRFCFSSFSFISEASASHEREQEAPN